MTAPKGRWLVCPICPNSWWQDYWLGPTCRLGHAGVVAYPRPEPMPPEGNFYDLFDKKPPPPPRRTGVPTRETVIKQVDGILRRLRAKPVGGRNPCLHWAACRVGELVVVGDVPDAAVAFELLQSVGLEVGLDHREVIGTIRSGFRRVGVVV